MNVQSCKARETICIGDDIEITVIATQGTRVKLGFVCPSDVRVLRAELRDRDNRIENESDCVEFHPQTQG